MTAQDISDTQPRTLHSMKQKRRIKTASEVRAEFERKGLSYADWARANKVPAGLVYEILREGNNRRCVRGTSHRVAVLLGMKEGEIALPTAKVRS